jgi:hypothetical protein
VKTYREIELMGSFYSNITLRFGDQARVADLLRGRRGAVSPEVAGYMVVFDSECDDQNWPEIDALVAGLSRDLNCVGLAILVHDDDVLYFVAYSGSAKIDEYNSSPSYFDFGATGGLKPPAGGNAAALSAAFSGDVTRIERVLRRWSEDEPYVFESDRHSDLIAELGLPLFTVGTALGSFADGQVPEGIDPSTMVWAADPPAPVDPRLEADRAFYDKLGLEDPAKPCKVAGCGRGAIQVGTRCRRHHFKMVLGRECPFD